MNAAHFPQTFAFSRFANPVQTNVSLQPNFRFTPSALSKSCSNKEGFSLLHACSNSVTCKSGPICSSAKMAAKQPAGSKGSAVQERLRAFWPFFWPFFSRRGTVARLLPLSVAFTAPEWAGNLRGAAPLISSAGACPNREGPLKDVERADVSPRLPGAERLQQASFVIPRSSAAWLPPLGRLCIILGSLLDFSEHYRFVW